MTRRTRLVAYLATGVVMGVLDALWISLVASGLYRDQLGDLVAESPRWAPALGFYLIFWFALCHFVVVPAVAEQRAWRRVVTDAALLGLTAYATWALTGWAVLADLTAAVALSDLVWGPVMSTTTAVVAVGLARASATGGSR
jgi:uncharacterized membrane protein